MAPTLRPGKSRWRGLGQLTPWLLLVAGLLMVRLSKGAGFTDAYALLSRPFWPGPAQREWVTAAADLEERSRLQLLEDDNRRLRGLLELQQQGTADGEVSSAVISRSSRDGGSNCSLARARCKVSIRAMRFWVLVVWWDVSPA